LKYSFIFKSKGTQFSEKMSNFVETIGHFTKMPERQNFDSVDFQFITLGQSEAAI